MKTFSAILLAVLSFTASAGATEKKDVKIKSPGGITIGASYFSAGKPGPGILLFHQCNLDRHSWDALGTLLAGAGYNVLAYDEPGYGDSQGESAKSWDTAEAAEKYWQEKWSGAMEAAYQYLRSEPGVNKNEIGAAGASCGVHMSLLLARAHPQQVKTLVLLSGPVDDADTKFVVASPAVAIFGAASEEDGNAFTWVKGIVATSKNPQSKFVAYKDAGHGTKMFGPQPELPGLVVEWFQAHMRVEN